jgi:catechol 2,3-dioxygenase-like lactoylglutathione lyase family enzyme
MLKRIESLIVTTERFDDALGFFKDKLGLELPSQSDNMARFEIDGFPIFLARTEKGFGSFVSIETNDIEADFKALQERGIEFREPIKSLKNGDKAAFFKGPANMEFMLYQPVRSPATAGPAPPIPPEIA